MLCLSVVRQWVRTLVCSVVLVPNRRASMTMLVSWRLRNGELSSVLILLSGRCWRCCAIVWTLARL